MAGLYNISQIVLELQRFSLFWVHMSPKTSQVRPNISISVAGVPEIEVVVISCCVCWDLNWLKIYVAYFWLKNSMKKVIVNKVIQKNKTDKHQLMYIFFFCIIPQLWFGTKICNNKIIFQKFISWKHEDRLLQSSFSALYSLIGWYIDQTRLKTSLCWSFFLNNYSVIEVVDRYFSVSPLTLQLYYETFYSHCIQTTTVITINNVPSISSIYFLFTSSVHWLMTFGTEPLNF